ncbi:MAG TPA: hypothetical protein PK056_06850 [Methylotenera sp.]|nr:hypothetical protein [Methylotenera sp.]
MITIHNFNEAFQQYQSGVIPYRLLQDQALVMLGICSNQHQTVANALDITDDDISWLLQQDETTYQYSEYLGGNVYICEVEADLLQIQGCDFAWAETHGGVWPNVTDMAMSWDSCGYLAESTGEPQWVIFLLCWNNAGGSVYYVPKHLWQAARVTEHITATDSAWNP